MNRRVAAIVVNWNGGDENLECLRSLVREGIEEEWIYFVDNDSIDGSREAVEAEFPNAVHIRNHENLGYGDANNQGIDLALQRGADVCLLVNNDAELIEGCLHGLLTALVADPNLAIVGPRVLYKTRPDLIWAAGGMLTFRQNLSTLIGHRRPDHEGLRKTIPVDYVIGAVMLVRKEVFEKIGLLDGSFFAYHEDLGFCVRASYEGFGVACVGEVAAYHHAGHSTGGGYSARRKYMIGVNSIWFLRRHGTPTRWARFILYDVLTLPLVWAAGLFRGRGAAVLSKAAGIRDGLRGIRVTAASVSERS